jgi:hypothetical protein
MRLLALLVAFAALVAGAPSSRGAATSALDPLAAAVSARLDATSGDTRAGRVRLRRLSVLGDRIAEPRSTLSEDMIVARWVGLALRRWFHRDAEFAPLYVGAVEALATTADDERRRVAAWTGKLGDAAREATLAARLRGIAAVFARANRSGGLVGKLRHFGEACARLERTRDELDLSGDPPIGAAMPDFALLDVNPNSPTYQRNVSPRDFLGMASAWYFGHAT